MALSSWKTFYFQVAGEQASLCCVPPVVAQLGFRFMLLPGMAMAKLISKKVVMVGNCDPALPRFQITNQAF